MKQTSWIPPVAYLIACLGLAQALGCASCPAEEPPPAFVEEGMEVARFLEESGRLSFAERVYEALLRAGARDPEVLARSTSLAALFGDWSSVLQTLRGVEIAPSWRQAPLLLGLRARARLEVDGVDQACLEDSLAFAEQVSDPHLLEEQIALAKLSQEVAAEFVRAAKRATASQPRLAFLRLAVLISIQSTAYDDAERWLKLAEREYGASASTCLELRGDLFLALGEPLEAQQAFARAIQEWRPTHSLLFKRATAAQLAERWEQAAEDYRQASEAGVEPWPEVHYRLGLCLARLGQTAALKQEISVLQTMGRSRLAEDLRRRLTDRAPPSPDEASAQPR